MKPEKKIVPVETSSKGIIKPNKFKLLDAFKTGK